MAPRYLLHWGTLSFLLFMLVDMDKMFTSVDRHYWFTSVDRYDMATTRPTPTVARVATLLKERRITHGLSQAELAKKAGVSRAWIAKMETGHRHPDLDTIIRVARALELEMGFTVLAPNRPTTPEADYLAQRRATRRPTP